MKAPREEMKKGLEAGIYHAICYSVIDAGTSENKFDGKKKRQLILGWKLLDQFYPDGNNLKLHKTVTFSMNERATLRKYVASWFSGQSNLDLDDFDFKNLLNKGCSLILAPNSVGNVTVENVMPYSTEGIDLDYVELFDLSTYKGGSLPENLDEWKKEMIKNSDEYKKANGQGVVNQAVASVQEAFGGKINNIDEGESEVPF